MVINGVISPLIWVIITVALLTTPLIATHDPPSRVWGLSIPILYPRVPLKIPLKKV